MLAISSTERIVPIFKKRPEKIAGVGKKIQRGAVETARTVCKPSSMRQYERGM